jgi:hypothetical protein
VVNYKKSRMKLVGSIKLKQEIRDMGHPRGLWLRERFGLETSTGFGSDYNMEGVCALLCLSFAYEL